MRSVHAVCGDARAEAAADQAPKRSARHRPGHARKKAGRGQREKSLTELYAILSLRFDGGESDVAARHEEHLP